MRVIVTEDQYLADLASLLRRYRIAPGSPGALDALAGELAENPALRGDLFNLCTAISHMSEADLSDREMLNLVVRALGGPRRSQASAEPVVPQSLHSVFLDQYARWLARDEVRGYAQENEDESWFGAPLPPSVAPFSAAASLSRAERASAGPAATNRTEIRPDTPIGDLTIAELRGYLDEIESRMGRLQPYLGSLGGRPGPDTLDQAAPHARNPLDWRSERLPQALAKTAAEAAAPEPTVAIDPLLHPEPPAIESHRPNPIPEPILLHRGRTPSRHRLHLNPRVEAPSAELTDVNTGNPGRSRSAGRPDRQAESVAAQGTEKASQIRDRSAARIALTATDPVAGEAAGQRPEPSDLDQNEASRSSQESAPVLPLRGRPERSAPGLARSAEQPECGSDALMFRSVSETPRSGSRYLLAIAASLVLIATTGAVGYRHLRAAGSSMPSAPAIAPPQLASPQATPQLTPPAVVGSPDGSAPKAADAAPHKPRALSRAFRVEAEAARSEDNSNSAAQPANGHSLQGSAATPAPASPAPNDQPQ